MDKTLTKATIACAIATVCLGLNTPIAALIYQMDGTALSVVFVRALGLVLLMAAWQALARKQPPTPYRQIAPTVWLLAIVAGVLLFGLSGLYMYSVTYIPVGLAAILFFTWPIWLALLDGLLGARQITPAQWFTFALAFVGITLSLFSGNQTIDPRGLLLALAASFCTAGYLYMVHKLLKHFSLMLLILLCNVVAIPLAIVFGDIHIPPAAASLYGLMSLLFAAGIILQMRAMYRLTPTTLAMISNMEPIISIFAALIILNELLSVQQYFGAATVVLALLLYALTQMKPRYG